MKTEAIQAGLAAVEAAQDPVEKHLLLAALCAALAQRYPEAVAIESWNEPNLWAFWRPQPDPDMAARLTAWVNAGVDLLSGFSDPGVITGLVAEGLVSPERVDEAAGRLLKRARGNVKVAIVMQKTGLPFPRASVLDRHPFGFPSPRAREGRTGVRGERVPCQRHGHHAHRAGDRRRVRRHDQ